MSVLSEANPRGCTALPVLRAVHLGGRRPAAAQALVDHHRRALVPVRGLPVDRGVEPSTLFVSGGDSDQVTISASQRNKLLAVTADRTTWTGILKMPSLITVTRSEERRVG